MYARQIKPNATIHSPSQRKGAGGRSLASNLTQPYLVRYDFDRNFRLNAFVNANRDSV